jgi:hypothetical protein
MNKKVPVLFLIFNRPDTTEMVFSTIRQYQPDKLYIAADGPRVGREKDAKLCKETRDIVKKIDWNCDVKTLYRDKNLGCKFAVSSAITWFFDNIEYGIILEDDILPDISFFHYCEVLLERYKDDTRIYQINGSNFLNIKLSDDYYFSRYPIIWGWASWRRAWINYDMEMDDFQYINKLKSLSSVLNTKKERKYFYGIFREMYKNKSNTWDTQWIYSVMRNNGVAISPNTNLVLNIGMNVDSSTHVFLKDKKRNPKVLNSINTDLKNIYFHINTLADQETFENVWAKSINRLSRLLMENGIIIIVKYVYLKFRKNK